MSKAKAICSPLASHFKLSSIQCLKSEADKKDMKKIPYALVVGSLMYVMVCTRSDITHAVGVVSYYLLNPSKEHWSTVK